MIPDFPSNEELQVYAALMQDSIGNLTRAQKIFINIYALMVVHGIFVGIGNIYNWIYG